MNDYRIAKRSWLKAVPKRCSKKLEHSVAEANIQCYPDYGNCSIPFSGRRTKQFSAVGNRPGFMFRVHPNQLRACTKYNDSPHSSYLLVKYNISHGYERTAQRIVSRKNAESCTKRISSKCRYRNSFFLPSLEAVRLACYVSRPMTSTVKNSGKRSFWGRGRWNQETEKRTRWRRSSKWEVDKGRKINSTLSRFTDLPEKVSDAERRARLPNQSKFFRRLVSLRIFRKYIAWGDNLRHRDRGFVCILESLGAQSKQNGARKTTNFLSRRLDSRQRSFMIRNYSPGVM